MPGTPEFQRKQSAFAAYIRDPDRRPAPANVEDRRLAIYRDLFFNNLNKLLGKSFPVLRAVVGDERWKRLVRDFMVHHRARTPYFLEVPHEMVEFLANGAAGDADDAPFVAELAHYEWVELALSISPERDDLSAIETAGDLLSGVPVKSALAWPLSYRFPVHRISPDFQPREPGSQPTCLVIYRRADDELGFMELNRVTTALLERIGNNGSGLSGRDLLLRLADEINYADAAALVEHGRNAMEDMRQAGILLGVRRP